MNISIERRTRVIALIAAIAFAVLGPLGGAAAKDKGKPDFAGPPSEKMGAGGRSDDARSHALERGEGNKYGLKKDRNKDDKNDKNDRDKAEKAEKPGKAKDKDNKGKKSEKAKDKSAKADKSGKSKDKGGKK